MPRHEFGGPVCERCHIQVNIDEVVVVPRVLHLDDGVQEIVLFLAGEIPPGPSKAGVAIPGGDRNQRHRPIQRKRNQHYRPVDQTRIAVSTLTFDRHCTGSFQSEATLSLKQEAWRVMYD